MRGKQYALSAGVLAMTILSGLPAGAGEAAEDGALGALTAVGAAERFHRTYDGKSMNLQVRRVLSRPPLPRRRPVFLPGRGLADAATLGRNGVSPAGGLEALQVKDELDATASCEKDGEAAGRDATHGTRVNFRAKY